MLCPKLTTQGQFIGKSEQGRAFAFRDCGGESENVGANALPLQICCRKLLKALIKMPFEHGYKCNWRTCSIVSPVT